MATMMLTSYAAQSAGMIPHALPGLYGGRLAYITTAAGVEPWGLAHTMLARRQLRQLGFRVTELDENGRCPRRAEHPLVRRLHICRRRQFVLSAAGTAAERRGCAARRTDSRRIPYIGESAGSVIMSPDIGYCSIMAKHGSRPGSARLQRTRSDGFPCGAASGQSHDGSGGTAHHRTVFHGARPTRAH